MEKSQLKKRRIFATDSFLAINSSTFFAGAILFAAISIISVFLALLRIVDIRELDLRFIIPMLISAAIGIILRLWDSRRRQYSQYLRRNGKATAANKIDITRIKWISFSYYGKKRLYYLKYQYTIDGKAYHGRSEIFLHTPQLASKTAQVYFDPDHPEKSIIDLGELGLCK